ncbi:MAG: hypothetical protein K6G79_09320 [Bacteroidales bacterium]|nr:hypothetical protein [Bacteroidales bacterium]
MPHKIHHTAIFLADRRNEERQEYAKLTLCFSDEGPYLLEDVYTPGWAAGNYGGGVVRTDLPADFYKGQTAESFAERFGGRFKEKIRQNAELAAFLEDANRESD